jgi:hypothetical protein
VVPTFVALGGGAAPGELTPAEAHGAALAVAALVAFCARHDDAIAAAAFPVADTVAVRDAGATVPVALAMPPVPGAGRRPGRADR